VVVKRRVDSFTTVSTTIPLIRFLSILLYSLTPFLHQAKRPWHPQTRPTLHYTSINNLENGESPCGTFLLQSSTIINDIAKIIEWTLTETFYSIISMCQSRPLASSPKGQQGRARFPCRLRRALPFIIHTFQLWRSVPGHYSHGNTLHGKHVTSLAYPPINGRLC